jgi:hypothetical protein
VLLSIPLQEVPDLTIEQMNALVSELGLAPKALSGEEPPLTLLLRLRGCQPPASGQLPALDFRLFEWRGAGAGVGQGREGDRQRAEDTHEALARKRAKAERDAALGATPSGWQW